MSVHGKDISHAVPDAGLRGTAGRREPAGRDPAVGELDALGDDAGAGHPGDVHSAAEHEPPHRSADPLLVDDGGVTGGDVGGGRVEATVDEREDGGPDG